jgi:RimJ/RimL family protein N-acetyltransferase
MSEMVVRFAPLSAAALDAEERSAHKLCEFLGVAAPSDWPPLYHDAGVRAWFRARLNADPSVARWLGRYVIATIDGEPTLVGTAGYKGHPDAAGAVEIGYSIVQSCQRRGIGLAAVRQLVDDAFADPRVRTVSAETPVTFSASRGLLERGGFALTGKRLDPDEGELALYSIVRG